GKGAAAPAAGAQAPARALRHDRGPRSCRRAAGRAGEDSARARRAPMKLSVVLPATDRPPTLERCLAAIAAADPPPDELIVVDDPSLRGPAAARNEGVSRATGEVVVFVDSDVVVHPDVFGRIRAAFEADTALVAVFGSYDDRVETRGVVAGFRNLLHHQMHQRYPG